MGMGRYQALVYGCTLFENELDAVFDGDGEPLVGDGSDLVRAQSCPDTYIGFRIYEMEALPDLVLRDGTGGAAPIREQRVLPRHQARLVKARAQWNTFASAMKARGVELPTGHVLLVEDYD